MNWFEQRIRRYEHRRWTTDDNRRVRPFEWGTEHVGGERDEAHPEGFLAEYATRALKYSKEWYETGPATDYLLDAENVFDVQLVNRVSVAGKQHRACAAVSQQGEARRGAGVAKLEREMERAARPVRMAQRLGISALKMSLPYHDRRMAKGHERADQLLESTWH